MFPYDLSYATGSTIGSRFDKAQGFTGGGAGFSPDNGRATRTQLTDSDHWARTPEDARATTGKNRKQKHAQRAQHMWTLLFHQTPPKMQS